MTLHYPIKYYPTILNLKEDTLKDYCLSYRILVCEFKQLQNSLKKSCMRCINLRNGFVQAKNQFIPCVETQPYVIDIA